MKIAAFPILSKAEFEEAASLFQKASQSCKASGWRDVQLRNMQDEPVLVVTRHLGYGDVQPLETDLQGHDEVEDEDEEALFREVSPGRQLSVEYHILLSSSYQVPVLYFSILDPAQSLPQTLDTVYQYLVPDRFQANLQGMAVMGGITKGYHPVSNLPMFFVHPCNTADAIGSIVEERKIEAVEYLLVWIGLVGSCVDLCVTSELAERLMRKT